MLLIQRQQHEYFTKAFANSSPLHMQVVLQMKLRDIYMQTIEIVKYVDD